MYWKYSKQTKFKVCIVVSSLSILVEEHFEMLSVCSMSNLRVTVCLIVLLSWCVEINTCFVVTSQFCKVCFVRMWLFCYELFVQIGIRIINGILKVVSFSMIYSIISKEYRYELWIDIWSAVFMYMRRSRGQNMEHWGTRHFTVPQFE